LALPLACAAGCLSLGGKTVYEEKPETSMRLAGLEARVASLEQTLSIRTVPAGATSTLPRSSSYSVEPIEPAPLLPRP
jgi:hypothetical protein